MLVKLELLLNNEQMLMAYSSPRYNAKPHVSGSLLILYVFLV